MLLVTDDYEPKRGATGGGDEQDMPNLRERAV